jgi:stage V sporulation protein SpoVS
MNLTFSPAPFKTEDGKLDDMPDHEFWMRTHDNVHKTATELLRVFTEEKLSWIDMACIGAGCLNTAIKCVAVARERVRKDRDLVVQPYFSTIVDEQNRERTRVMLRVTLVNA